MKWYYRIFLTFWDIEVRFVLVCMIEKQQAEENTTKTVDGWTATKDMLWFVLHSYSYDLYFTATEKADNMVLKEHCFKKKSGFWISNTCPL